jgi:hypothetical protein
MIKFFQYSALLIAAVFLTAGAVSAQATPWQCNNQLVNGVYGFTLQGAKLGGPGPVGPQVGVALTDFDGKGGLTQIDTVTINGIVVADFTHAAATGTYTINPDCTGTFSITFTDGRPPITVALVVVDNGNEIDTVVTSAGGQQGLIATQSIGKRRFSTPFGHSMHTLVTPTASQYVTPYVTPMAPSRLSHLR